MTKATTEVATEVAPGGALEELWLSGLHPESPASITESNAAYRLLLAARDAFATNGYNGTTTRDIASRAGMSPAAMYIHYPSKQAMLFKLSLIGHRACLESLAAAVDIDAAPRKRLRAGMYAFTHFHAEHHVLSRTIQYDVAHLEGEHYEQVADIRRAIHRTIQDLLEQGAVSGDFKIGDVAVTTLGILSMAIDTVRWFPSRTMSDPAVLAAHYAALADTMVGAGG